MVEFKSAEYPPAYDPQVQNTRVIQVSVNTNEDQPFYGYQEDSVGFTPRQFYCPNCNRFNWSKVSNKIGVFSWLICMYMCLIGCWVCCFIPFLVSSCQDTVHSCAACGQSFAVVSPF